MVEFIAGGILSLDPLVTYSRGGETAPYGLAGLFPELFRNRRAVHLIGLSWTIERHEAAYADGLRRLQSELGDENLLVVAANDDYEASLLSSFGVPGFVGSHLLFIDEKIFRPMTAPAGARTFDSVYNARLDPFKRHELAAALDSLMLIHFQLGGDQEQFARVRQLLPNAYFANKELSGEEQHWLPSDKVAERLSCCRVGLCLSAREGAMRAAMEYLLCGLSVVTTRSVGGRSRYLMPPFAMVVDDSPEAVARGVREMLARNIPKAAVRDHIGRMLTFERHAFLETVNRIGESHFGIGDIFKTVEPFIKSCNEHRPVSEAIAPLAMQRSTVAAPAVVATAPAQSKTLAFVLGRGRSGSHLLRSFLSQHESISAIGEVFNQDLARRMPMNFNDFLIAYLKDNPGWRMRHAEAETILRGYFSWVEREAGRPKIVVDVRDDQLRILDWPSSSYVGPSRLLRFIREPGHPIIHLTRKDKLSQYASAVLAQRTGRWSRAPGEQADAAPKSLKLDPDAVLEALADAEASEAMLDKWLAGRSRIARVVYETMLDGDGLSATARRDIGEALGVEMSSDMRAGTAKLAPPLRDLVENIDEILERLSGTPFAWLRDLHGPRG